MVSACTEQPLGRLAGACGGMEALALRGTTTERQVLPATAVVAMSAFAPKRTSKARQSGGQETYFFTLDLLGGEPVWQVLHGLPFAIWGVACALDVVSEFIASVRKNMITVPITVVTIPVFGAGVILPSNLSGRGKAADQFSV